MIMKNSILVNYFVSRHYEMIWWFGRNSVNIVIWWIEYMIMCRSLLFLDKLWMSNLEFLFDKESFHFLDYIIVWKIH